MCDLGVHDHLESLGVGDLEEFCLFPCICWLIYKGDTTSKE
jgi:hypothetical protein